MLRTLSFLAIAAFVGVGEAVPRAPAAAIVEAPAAGLIKIAARRITETQYRNTIRDIFGPDIKVDGRFEPEMREAGLLAVGRVQLSVTTSGFEQYFAMATSVADQALDSKRRDKIVACRPVDPKQVDRACAERFIETYGMLLFRRPLTRAETGARLATVELGAQRTGDFYGSLKLALTSLLVAPEHLFRIELAEPDPANAGQYRLDGYSKASRLSFLFWDVPPDAELIAAARSGAIHAPDGLRKQLARLSASARLQDGARALFADMLQLDQFDGLTKDTMTYPKFSQAVADSAKEQALRTVVDLLVVKRRDYRDLFTSNETVINRHLAAVYQVPFRSADAWAPFIFPDSSERSGILTQIAFLSLFAHPAASSPTRRGVKLREIFLCQATAPPNVDFSQVQALDKGTVRVRLLAHMENPVCASCHKISDPPGLALERFDGLGQLRTSENGQPIDVSSTFNGVKFSGARGLGKVLRDEPGLPACLVRNVYAYGVGRDTDESDEPYLASQARAFAANGFRLADMMMRMAASPEFFEVKIPSGARPADKVAVVEPRANVGSVR